MLLQNVHLRRICAGIGAVLLLIVVLTDLLYTPGHSFLVKTSGTAMANLGGIAAINIAAGFTGVLDGFSDILSRVMSFMIFSNLMILFQLLLLELSRSWLIKILVIICLILVFFPGLKFRQFVLKFLAILLLINPGLALYLTGVGLISRSAVIDLGGRITRELNIASGNTNIISLTNADRGNGLQGTAGQRTTGPTAPSGPAVDDGTIPEPDSKAVSGPVNRFWPQITSMFERLKLSAAGKWQSAVSTAGKTCDAARYLLSGALEKILSLVMNYFVSVLLLFILLPFLYFYVLLNLLKDLLQYVLKGRS